MSFHFHPALQVEEELYGDAILTSLPMRLMHAGRLLGGSMLEPRGALWAAVKAENAEIQVINTHLSLAAFERWMQVDTLLGAGWLGHPNCKDPVILLGDFNAVRQSRVYRRLSARLRDAQTGLHRRPRRTFPARMPMLRIDHIFCSRSIEVLGVEVPRSRLIRTASDHLPVVIDFRVLDSASIDRIDAAGASPGLQPDASERLNLSQPEY
jgi:endonuclease/exonuclease/phosphatase family metal-dependent hydrolase